MKQLAGDELERIRAAHKGINGSQPVHGLETDDDPAAHVWAERRELLDAALGDAVRHLTILDVGSSDGYLSLHLADRQANVVGIDRNPKKVEFCRTLSKALGVDATFKLGLFSDAYAEGLEEGEFDVALIFGALDDLAARSGTNAARQALLGLLEKVDLVFLGPGQNSPSLPELVRGLEGIAVDEVGRTDTAPPTSAPLYRLAKTVRRFNGIEHSRFELRRSAKAGNWNKDRKYFVTDARFTKCVMFKEPFFDAYTRFVSEIAAYQRLASHPHVLPLIGTEIRGKAGFLTFPRIDGPSLPEVLMSGRVPDVRGTALAIKDVLQGLADAGLYWNDFRHQNLGFHDGRLVAFDFEYAHPLEIENTLNIFLWVLWDLQSGDLASWKSGVFEAALRRDGNLNLARPPAGPEDYAAEVRDLAAAAYASTGIREFLKRVRGKIAAAVLWFLPGLHVADVVW